MVLVSMQDSLNPRGSMNPGLDGWRLQIGPAAGPVGLTVAVDQRIVQAQKSEAAGIGEQGLRFGEVACVGGAIGQPCGAASLDVEHRYITKVRDAGRARTHPIAQK